MLSAHWRASHNAGGSPGADDPVAPTGYAAWKLFHFNALEQADPAISGQDANPDGDRWSNFTEYAFVTDPRADGGAAQPHARIEGDQLKLVFRRPRAAPDVVYRLDIAHSADGDWEDAGSEVVLAVIATDADAEVVEATFQTAIGHEASRYVRLAALPSP